MVDLLDFASYDDDAGLYIVNHADRIGDPPDSNPAIRDLQSASRESILRGCLNPANLVVKVAAPGPHRAEVRGYATLARYLAGAAPRRMEAMLGMRSGALAGGCRVFRIDPAAITADNIGPRYFTAWSAGVSPRDLEVVSQRAGVPVEYHRDYPAASEPIPQFVLYRPVATLGSLVLGYDEVLEPERLR